MDATPYLAEIGRGLRQVGLEAVLIGNAAAALQGAPVTTVDFDFLFRKTPRNLRKLKTLSGALGAIVLRPYYPASDLYRVVRDDGLQIDFMATIPGHHQKQEGGTAPARSRSPGDSGESP